MMDRVIERATRPAGSLPRRATVACIVIGALIASACGGSDGTPTAEAATTSPATEAPTTVATTTVAPTTTLERPSTTAATTTTPTTTTVPTSTTEPIVVTLPTTTVVAKPLAQPAGQPVAPPADSYAREPIIEVGSIVIPKIGVDMTMYEGIRLSTLDYGPGHWPGTAMPGEAGNVVVGGHRTSSHRVFRNVDKLTAGDEIIFRSGGLEHVYRVNRVEIVDPTAVWIVNPTETPTATLFACHPPGSTAQRIVVFADLVTT